MFQTLSPQKNPALKKRFGPRFVKNTFDEQTVATRNLDEQKHSKLGFTKGHDADGTSSKTVSQMGVQMINGDSVW